MSCLFYFFSRIHPLRNMFTNDLPRLTLFAVHLCCRSSFRSFSAPRQWFPPWKPSKSQSTEKYSLVITRLIPKHTTKTIFYAEPIWIRRHPFSTHKAFRARLPLSDRPAMVYFLLFLSLSTNNQATGNFAYLQMHFQAIPQQQQQQHQPGIAHSYCYTVCVNILIHLQKRT